MASRQSKSSQDTAGAGTTPSAATPTRHVEIETKLEIPSARALPILTGRRTTTAVGLVGAADPLTFELDAVYFDTAELDLLRSRLTLRHRTGGEDAGWHLKLPALAGARTEIGLPLESVDVDPLTAHVPAALADLVLGAARGRALRPVARIRNVRTVRRLLDSAGTAMIEVADDQVTSTRLTIADSAAGVTAGRVAAFSASEPTRWRELEVEILAGDRDQLGAVVALLRQAGAKPASSASKLARALDAHRTPPAGKTKSAHTNSVGPVVTGVLSRLRDHLIGADRGLREGTEVALHDARAAARRVRSVLSVYSPVFEPGATRSLRTTLRDFGVVLGRARDLEVLQRRLVGQLVEEPTEYATAAAARMNAAFAAALPVALADVAELIRSQPYLDMLRELDAFIATPPFSRRATKSASTELPLHLSAAWRDLDGLVEQALGDPFGSPGLHDVRKSAKALRYAAEAASATLGDAAVVFAAAIEEIQEVLGEHQDAAAAAAWLAALALEPDTDGVSGFVFGRLHAFEQAVAHGTVDDFSDAWDRVEDGDILAGVFGR
ncbi:CHAD domain-containing protein [Nakamurella sp. UYEF19]|uniref:CYTH and CHAD domain-containing protein n=1 Tax=Nakamurella sp. UYEF19 TaxID=1756392 RepID=UPI003396CA33